MFTQMNKYHVICMYSAQPWVFTSKREVFFDNGVFVRFYFREVFSEVF